MRAHVTGSRGFVAGHLIRELEDRGHDVTGSDLEAALSPELILGDDPPDVVVHAGAVVGRELRGQGPANAIALNASSTYLLANACAALKVPLLYLSTSEVYGERDGTLAFEDDELVELPHNLYALTKRWGEEASRLAFRGREELLTIARLSMPYGPGHLPGTGRAALTNFLWAAMHGDPLPVHRGARRSWCWIGDTVRALGLLVERVEARFHFRAATEVDVFNVGRDDNELPMLSVAELAIRLARDDYPEGAAAAVVYTVDPPEGFTLVKRLDTSRLRELGWRPAVELEEGAELTLEWLSGLPANVFRR